MYRGDAGTATHAACIAFTPGHCFAFLRGFLSEPATAQAGRNRGAAPNLLSVGKPGNNNATCAGNPLLGILTPKRTCASVVARLGQCKGDCSALAGAGWIGG